LARVCVTAAFGFRRGFVTIGSAASDVGEDLFFVVDVVIAADVDVDAFDFAADERERCGVVGGDS
jgi:hypothetical protein